MGCCNSEFHALCDRLIYIRMENKCFYARVSLDQVVQVMFIFISNILVKYKNNGRFSITNG